MFSTFPARLRRTAQQGTTGSGVRGAVQTRERAVRHGRHDHFSRDQAVRFGSKAAADPPSQFSCRWKLKAKISPIIAKTAWKNLVRSTYHSNPIGYRDCVANPIQTPTGPDRKPTT